MLLVYLPPDLEPDQAEIGAVFEVGEVVETLGRRSPTDRRLWRVTSEGAVQSNDLRAHLDWLLALRLDIERWVTHAHSDTEIRCVWLSRSGSGGPTLSAPQLRRLAQMNRRFILEVRLLEPESRPPRFV